MRTFISFALGMAVVAAPYCAYASDSDYIDPPARPVTHCAKPAWPKKSWQNEDTGVVQMAFLLGEDGFVKDARVEQSSGVQALDEAALQGIRTCHFPPPNVDGKAVERWYKMEFAWVPIDEMYSAQKLLLRKDYRGAASMLRIAAGKGQAAAQYQLAVLLNQGEGVSKDPEQARIWLKRSASQLYAPAMGAYGTALLHQGGADLEAFKWLQDGAAQDDANSMYMLAACYEDGRGTEVDMDKAKFWYGRAAEKGHAEASVALKELNQASK